LLDEFKISECALPTGDRYQQLTETEGSEAASSVLENWFDFGSVSLLNRVLGRDRGTWVPVDFFCDQPPAPVKEPILAVAVLIIDVL
jgi:hypothetical protein